MKITEIAHQWKSRIKLRSYCTIASCHCRCVAKDLLICWFQLKECGASHHAESSKNPPCSQAYFKYCVCIIWQKPEGDIILPTLKTDHGEDQRRSCQKHTTKEMEDERGRQGYKERIEGLCETKTETKRKRKSTGRSNGVRQRQALRDIFWCFQDLKIQIGLLACPKA